MYRNNVSLIREPRECAYLQKHESRRAERKTSVPACTLSPVWSKLKEWEKDIIAHG